MATITVAAYTFSTHGMIGGSFLEMDEFALFSHASSKGWSAVVRNLSSYVPTVYQSRFGLSCDDI